MTLNSELLIAIITFAGAFCTVSFMMYKAHRNNVKAQQQMTDKIIQNEKDIERNREDFVKACNDAHSKFIKEILQLERTFDLKLENIRTERIESLNKINSDISSLKRLHENDINDVYRQFDSLSKKIDDNHHDLINRFENLSIQVATICATFQEYRKNNSKND